MIIFSGPRAMKASLTEKAAETLHKEYSDLRMSVEVVESVEEAIKHIHDYGR